MALMSARIRKYVAIIVVIIGLWLMYSYISFFITHVDDIQGAYSGAFRWPMLEFKIGAFILVLAPLVLRLYLWAILQFLLTTWFIFLQ